MSHDLLVQMAYSYGVTIQMKPLPSAILSHGGTIYLEFSSNFWVSMKSYGVTIQVKPLQQYFHMVLFV